MKVTNKFYLLQVGQDIVSPLGFRYNLHTTDIFELKIWCGFDSIERLYKSAICNGIHTYKIYLPFYILSMERMSNFCVNSLHFSLTFNINKAQ